MRPTYLRESNLLYQFIDSDVNLIHEHHPRHIQDNI